MGVPLIPGILVLYIDLDGKNGHNIRLSSSVISKLEKFEKNTYSFVLRMGRAYKG